MGTKCGLLALVTGNGGLWSCRLIESSGQVTKRQGGCGFQYLFNSSSEKVVAGSVGRPSRRRRRCWISCISSMVRAVDHSRRTELFAGLFVRW